MALLETKGLTKVFGGLTAVNDLDMTIKHGEILGLVGPNGSGKSTCINLIAGSLTPTSGDISFNGLPISDMKPYTVAGKGIARTYQLTSLFPNLTVKENIIYSRYLKSAHSLLGSFFKSLIVSKAYREEEKRQSEKAEEILTFLEMAPYQNVKASNMPTMEQRKLEIGIALATEPELLLLDEPGAGMNPAELDRMTNLIQSIRQSGITLMLVEHNMKVITGICTRMVVINQGSKIAEGDPEVVINNPEVVKCYLGEDL